ncbi:MAG: hypothetical protein RR768_02135 [Clostridium sp.]
MPNENDNTIFMEAYNQHYRGSMGEDAKRYMTGGMVTQDLNRLWPQTNSNVDITAMPEFDQLPPDNPLVEQFNDRTNPLRSQTVKTLYEMRRSGMARSEVTRSDGSSLDFLLTLQVKKDHPEFYLEEIINIDRSQNKEEIERIKEETGLRLMQQMSTREGLTDVLSGCNKLYAGLDFGREAEYAAGISPTLPEEERKALYKTPACDGAMTAFYRTLGLRSVGYFQLTSSIGLSGREVVLVGEVTGELEEKLQDKPWALDTRRQLAAKMENKSEILQFQNALMMTRQMGRCSKFRAELIDSGYQQTILPEAAVDLAQYSIIRDKMAERERTGRISLPFIEKTTSPDELLVAAAMSQEERQEIVVHGSEMLTDKLLYDLNPPSATPTYDFTKLSPNAVLSDRVIDKVRGMNQKISLVFGLVNDYKNNHPEKKNDEWGDTRDFVHIIDTRNLSDDQVREKTQNTLDDYYDLAHPEKRKRILDEFIDGIDHTNIAALDLSILTANPPTDEEKIKKSEDDVVRLCQRISRDQSPATKLKENKSYADARYADPLKRAHYEDMIQLANSIGGYINNTVVFNSGYTDATLVGPPGEEAKEVSLKFPLCTTICAMKLYLDKESHISGKKSDGVLPLLATAPFDEVVGIEKMRRPLDDRSISSAVNILDGVLNGNFMQEKKDWNQGGIKNLSELFFIDGKSVEELYGSVYQDLPEADKEKALRAEIMSAVISGEHHIDMAALLPNSDGSMEVQMYGLKTDLSFLDQKQKETGHWYQTLNSKKAEKNWNNDKGRDTRLEAEKMVISEKMMTTIQKSIIEKEASIRAAEEVNRVKPETQAEVARTEIDLNTLCNLTVKKTEAQPPAMEHAPEKSIGK